MEIEIEAKFLDVKPEELRKKLFSSGAKQVHPEITLKRKVFDYPDRRLEKIRGWVRVRDEGEITTLSYKQVNDRTLYGTKELVVLVDDFENASNFLISIGLEQKAYQETKREKWMLDNTEISIDTWPWIPTFVELEGKNEKELGATVEKLGLDWSKAMHGSVETAYQKYYNITEEEIYEWKKVTFVPVPDWLMIKKKK